MGAFEYLATLSEKVAPGNAALVVVDLQNDFVAPGGFADQAGWPLDHNQRAAECADALVAEARATSVPVIFVQSIYDEVHLSYPMRERNERNSLALPRCVSDTWGADFYGAGPKPQDHVVIKHRYSAFADTGLDTLLRGLNVQSLILAGVNTEVCVESTARDGYFLDYYIVVAEDCCATTTEEAHIQAVARLDRDYGVVANSSEIVAAWSQRAS